MFACIYIPDFPVAAIVRTEPVLCERAVAVLDGKPPQVRVAALNDNARLLGMEIGMTRLQAAIFAVAEIESASAKRVGSRKQARQIELAPQRTKMHPKPAVAVLRQRSLEREESAHAALLDAAHAFTPRVEDTYPDRLLVDLDGLERLYGSAASMGRELAARVSAVGLECNIGVASNPDAAMHAACGFSGITVLPVGEEARRLGVLPISVLLDSFDAACRDFSKTSAAARERQKLREQMLDTLDRWGVRDFRTLALLPEHALASRLGESGTRLQLLARGVATRTLALCQPPAHFEEAMELESAVETLEPLSFLINRLLEQLCARLEARALAVQELQLRLQLERRVADEQAITLEDLAGVWNTTSSPGPSGLSGKITTESPGSQRTFLKETPCPKPALSEVEGCPRSELFSARRNDVYTRTLRLPVAMRDPKVFLKLLQLDLGAHPPEAPVCKLWLAAKPARPRSAQCGLFLPITPEAEKLEITLARIAGVVGDRRAGIATLLDTYRPDGFRMERFAAPQESGSGNVTPTSSDMTVIPPLALRIFRPARRILVQLAEERPIRLLLPVRSKDPAELQGTVVWSAGPWRSSGDWWAEPSSSQDAADCTQAWSREEWDIALAQNGECDIALYRIYRDAGTGDWFADASYD